MTKTNAEQLSTVVLHLLKGKQLCVPLALRTNHVLEIK